MLRAPKPWLLILCLLSLSAAPARALRLFAPTPAGLHLKSALTGVDGVQLLTIDQTALVALRSLDHTDLDDFPLGEARTATIELTRFEPFPANARVEIVGADGPRPLALPDRAYFAGLVRGEPTSRVLVIAGATTVEGFVMSGGDVYPFGPDDHGRHRSYAMTKADATRYPPPEDFCANDLEPAAIEHPSPLQAAPALSPVTADAGTPPQRIADLAIETDTELRAKFSSDAAALAYLTSLLAASTAIYERDANVHLQYSYVRLWAADATDPWTATTTGATLGEVLNYWNDPANHMATTAGPHDLVHFLSGKSVRGGIAYINVLCDQSYGFGVSQIYGSFDLSNPAAIWDLVVFTHELGHNFGSPHSHCYNPPLDHCYGGEAGCYAGEVATSRGNLMSYCHLRSGGLANIDLTFGDTVSQRIRDTAQGASCLATVPSSSSTTTSTSTTSSTSRASTTSTTATTTTTATSSTTTGSSASTTSRTTSTAISSSTQTTTPTTSTTTLPLVDQDGDGVPDARDLCAATEPGELVDATGCSQCPCAPAGEPWRSHSQYVRCVRSALAGHPALANPDLERAAIRHAQRSTCGRRAVTRCCVLTGDAITDTCRVMKTTSCGVRAAGNAAIDLGPGSCLPSPCAD